MAAADALPVPIKNTAFRLYFEVRKNDGTLITTWTGQDSEVSLDGAAYADCTNEATEIGTSGTGYIDLTSTEMNADFVFYKLTVTNTDALVTVIPIVTTVGGEIPADPTGIRAALGLATANLDTQLTAIDTVVDSVLVDTAVIGALGAGLTAIPWNASWDAEVQSEVADALTVYDPPTNAELDSGLAALNDLSAAEMRTALGLGSANLDTQLADLPTNAELATALASADDAVLAALATVDSNVDSILVDTVDIQSRLPAALVSGRMDSSVGAMAANTLTASALATDAVDELADGVWDEVLTGATHNIATSAGRRLRELGTTVIATGTAQAGAGNSITLATGESTTSEIYDENLVTILSGTGVGQSRMITDYNGSTRVAIVNRVWEVNPDNTSEYQINAFAAPVLVEHGLAQAGAASTITLATTASAVDDVYNNLWIYITTSTGSGQTRLITDYDGASRVATVTPAWNVNPGSASVYKIVPAAVLPWNTDWDAEVQSEATDALNAYDPPTNTEMEARTIPSADYFVVSDYTAPSNASIASILTVIQKLDGMLQLDGALYQFTVNALEQAPAGEGGGGGASAADIADAVLDEALSGHVSAGSAGYALGLIDDVKTKTDAIGTSAAYALSPTIAANTVRIVRGDDYSATDSRAIDLVYSGQPDFTSATSVTMKIVNSNNRVSTTLATWTGSVVNATTLRFTPTDTETALLPAINSQTQITYPFEVSLTLASGNVITPTSLHAGRLLVDAQAT